MQVFLICRSYNVIAKRQSYKIFKKLFFYFVKTFLIFFKDSELEKLHILSKWVLVSQAKQIKLANSMQTKTEKLKTGYIFQRQWHNLKIYPKSSSKISQVIKMKYLLHAFL